MTVLDQKALNYPRDTVSLVGAVIEMLAEKSGIHP